MREFKKWFAAYIVRGFGKKCRDFTWGCHVCHAHFVKEMFNDFVDEMISDEKWAQRQKHKRGNSSLIKVKG